MALSIKRIEAICKSKFPCKVQDGGFGDHKHGYRTVKIIVGKKANTAFESDVDKRKKLKKGDICRRREIPDVRIIYVPGNASRDWLLTQIKRIYKTLPENQTIGPTNRDDSIVGIEGDPNQFYAKPKKRKKVEPDWDEEEDWDEDEESEKEEEFEEDWDDENDEDEAVDDEDWDEDDDEESEGEDVEQMSKKDFDKNLKDIDEEVKQADELMEGVGKLNKVVIDLVEGQRETLSILKGFDKRIIGLESGKDEVATKKTNKTQTSKNRDE